MNKKVRFWTQKLQDVSKLSSIIQTVHFYMTEWPIWDEYLSLINILLNWAALFELSAVCAKKAAAPNWKQSI